MRVLIAPDSFKGTMSARTVADALAVGASEACADVTTLPLADGGEGTATVLLDVLDGEVVTARVSGPLGEPIEATFVVSSDGQTAVVETAEASGLHRLRHGRLDAEAASTAGTGELLVAASRLGVRRILLGVGGSATTDGGLGALEAIASGGGLRGAALSVLCDVQTPYERAAVVYGAQKGADELAVVRLTQRLHSIAQQLPRDPRGRAMTGAAGGLSGALWASLGADLLPGIDAIMDLVGFDQIAGGCELVITGEGRVDSQTREGKVVAGVARRSSILGLPVWAVAGATDLSQSEAASLGLQGIVVAGDPGSLRAAARRLAGTMRSSG